MQPTTQRDKRGIPPTQRPAALYSPAAAKLIGQIQAEARAKLLEELSAQDGVIVLHPLDDASVRHDGRSYSVTDARGAAYSGHRDHVKNDRPSYSRWHPAHWLVSVTLVDGIGAKWYRLLGTFVCDDFGNLVEVPA